MILRYSVAWFPMILIAILNGIFRESVLAKRLSELRAHQLSSLMGIVFFFGYTWLVSLKWPLQSTGQALTVGLIWLLLTVLFEFIFGHYLVDYSWQKLFQHYNILAGRLWLLVLLAVAFLPLIVFTIRN